MKNLTKHRRKILESMQNRKDHPTARMVFDTIREDTDRISFATVYNTLEYLVNHGFVKRLNIDSDSCRYDACLDKHAHLICTICGAVIDAPSINLAESIHLENYNFQLEEVTVSVTGTCSCCKSSH